MLNALLSLLGLTNDSSGESYTKPDTLDQTDQTDDTLKEAPPLSEPVPRPILAFRTATILLSQLLEREIIPEYKPKAILQQSIELKVADAFAHVAVADSDVIAIATHLGPSSLKVIALTTVDSRLPISEASIDKEVQETPNVEDQPSIFQYFYRLVKKHRSKEPDSAMKLENPFPVIVDPRKLGKGDETLEAQLLELQKAW